MPRATTKQNDVETVEDFRRAVVRVGMKLCDNALHDKARDERSNLEMIVALFNAVK